jgi:hypothetical protein
MVNGIIQFHHKNIRQGYFVTPPKVRFLSKQEASCTNQGALTVLALLVKQVGFY